MNSAYEYCEVFKKAEQIGRLYVLPSGHARGSTFHIYVLPEGLKLTDDNFFKMNLDNDIVEVYGIISGEPGWTETYGWIHEGKWQTDFEEIYQKRLKELEEEKAKLKALKKSKEAENEKRIKSLLDTYK